MPATPTLPDVIWTSHALSRAQARFPGVDLNAALVAAKRPGKGLRRKISEACPGAIRRMIQGDEGIKGRYWLVNREHGIVFIMHPPAAVITVFPLDTDISVSDKDDIVIPKRKIRIKADPLELLDEPDLAPHVRVKTKPKRNFEQKYGKYRVPVNADMAQVALTMRGLSASP